MFYFAYGSNMDPRQIIRRCPSYRFYSRAILTDYKLDFTLRSRQRRCGVANVVPCKTAKVIGVIYRINSTRDWARLDRAEGFRKGKKRSNRYVRSQIFTTTINDKKLDVLAYIYIGLIEKSPPPPSNAYLDQMIYGADHWGLPAEYIQDLVDVKKDLSIKSNH
jgi:hypothetical protein